MKNVGGGHSVVPEEDTGDKTKQGRTRSASKLRRIMRTAEDEEEGVDEEYAE